MSYGILYIATGEDYIKEAKISAQSVQEHNPEINTAIATDEPLSSQLFEQIIPVDDLEENFSASNISPQLSPYDKTVFLDTDTYVTGDINGLFDLLEKYDLAVAHAPNKNNIPGLPDPVVEYNTGVIAYRNTDKVNSFLTKWEETYKNWKENMNIVRNQPSFTKCIYDSDISVYTLPSEYNVRTTFPGYVARDVKILHGRQPAALSSVAAKLSISQSPRVYYPNSYLSSLRPFKLVIRGSLRYRLESSIYEDGVLTTFRRIPKYLQELIRKYKES